MGWIAEMDRRCPFCGEEMEVSPGAEVADVGRARCGACGYDAVFNVPDAMRAEPFGPVIAVRRGGRARGIPQ